MTIYHHNQATLLLPGMIVRFPIDIEELDFRDYRIGRIEKIDSDLSIATIRALIYDLHEDMNSHEVMIVSAESLFERPLDQLSRCRVLANSHFTSISAPSISGQVLFTCEENFSFGKLLDYFVQIGDQVLRMSEADLLVGSTVQDVDPVDQALRYELQNPSWHNPRDHVVEAYSELQSATFGIEDLVGSRVFLLAHQAEVVTRVLSSTEGRFMLADEVGLGKTIEACVIFKALRRRNPKMRTLIIAPDSLTHQWKNEISQKFWLDLPIIHPESGPINPSAHPGVIISLEDLAKDDVSWEYLSRYQWGLLIVDEAHHLHKSPALYDRICKLSADAERVLILTATPIQRRTTEYLSLLRILDPCRYANENEESFGRLLEAQKPIRTAITLTIPLLDSTDIDAEELSEELEPLTRVLGDDPNVVAMLADLAQSKNSPSDAQEIAKQIVIYVSTNYRIEGRMIRNRRSSLEITLPQRTLDTSYGYTPSSQEEATLNDLYDYGQNYLSVVGSIPLSVEYVRLLLYSAASSPHALCDLLHWREETLRQGRKKTTGEYVRIGPAAPRYELRRIRQIIASAPMMPREIDAINRLVRQAEYWQSRSTTDLDAFKRSAINRIPSDRLVQCLRAIYQAVEGNRSAKVLVFTGWTQTAKVITERIRTLLGLSAARQFTADMEDQALQEAADHFQSSDDCSVLICDELGGEGRNFQSANCIIHIDIPWTPAQVEQRIGRVDRLGRSGEVRSIPLFAQGMLDHDLFRLWDEGLALFTRSMSGMEIALEETQEQLVHALSRSVRHGIAEMLDPMRRQSVDLREEIEKDRLYEREGTNKELRRQFELISMRYSDGEMIRSAIRDWTSMAGLTNFQPRGEIMIYEARNFKLNAMTRARFLPPNMQEAARRRGQQRTPQIVGTFNRDLAVRREDLVFFAPGDDPWTDAVIRNALENDRGRCCAIGFHSESAVGKSFFELLYAFHINPRALYNAELSPIYLLYAQSYLPRPYLRLLIDGDGVCINRDDPRWQLIKRHFKTAPFSHLGERKLNRGNAAAVDQFRKRYPTDMWRDSVHSCIDVAEQYIQADIIEYAAELADEAAKTFARRIAGWEAGLRWQSKHSEVTDSENSALDAYRRAFSALETGIRNPVFRLESICFWEQLGNRQ